MVLVMKAVPSPLVGVAVLALALTAAARAEGIRSPFLPPNAGNGNASSVDPNAIQLRGIMSTGSGVKYNIYDPGKKTSVWVGINESGNGFLIKSADTRRDAVTVAANGQQITLQLKEAKVQTPAANGVPQGGAILRPTPADEQVRLQAVADEVRRRRLLREQAANSLPGAMGQPGFAAPPQQVPGAISVGTGMNNVADPNADAVQNGNKGRRRRP
jgi:hypothetical protein